MSRDQQSGALRPPLLVDTDRVLSTPADVVRRLPAFVDANRERTVWGEMELRRLFTVANLLAYQAARSLGAKSAERLLSAQIGCLLTLADDGAELPVGHLGFDPVLNRIRLAAQSGRVDEALSGIDACLGGSESRLFADADRPELDRLLRLEKLLIMWRSGRLATADPAAARALIVECGAGALPLTMELELRLRLGRTPAPPPFALEPGDTLKRALHRALVHIDELAPAAQPTITTIVLRGLDQLPAMSFVSAGTPLRWASIARRWFASNAADLVPAADRALALARERIASAVARDLDAAFGPPSPRAPKGDSTLLVSHIEHVVRLLDRATVTTAKAAAHAH